MSTGTTTSQPIGTLTVSDLMLLVAASSVSILLIVKLLPAVPTTDDYLLLSAYCGPAGLAVFGPWAVRRQFVDSSREELEPGEWLWIALAGAWLAATPLILVTAGSGIAVFSALMMVLGAIVGLTALVQSFLQPRRRPWTHWAGILLCLLHAAPLFVGFTPLLWSWIEGAFVFWSI
jgi:hypothetical protein